MEEKKKRKKKSRTEYIVEMIKLPTKKNQNEKQ